MVSPFFYFRISETENGFGIFVGQTKHFSVLNYFFLLKYPPPSGDNAQKVLPAFCGTRSYHVFPPLTNARLADGCSEPYLIKENASAL